MRLFPILVVICSLAWSFPSRSEDDPLRVAVMEGSYSEVKRLLESSANYNQMDDIGMTPFFWAVYNATNSEKDDDFKIMDLLLSAGVDINHAHEKGKDALSIAVTNSRSKNESRVVQYLLQNGADPNTRRCFGANCISQLMNAIRLGNKKVVQLLLDYGADVNYAVKGDTGSSALRTARENKKSDLEQLLVKRGAR